MQRVSVTCMISAASGPTMWAPTKRSLSLATMSFMRPFPSAPLSVARMPLHWSKGCAVGCGACRGLWWPCSELHQALSLCAAAGSPRTLAVANCAKVCSFARHGVRVAMATLSFGNLPSKRLLAQWALPQKLLPLILPLPPPPSSGGIKTAAVRLTISRTK